MSDPVGLLLIVALDNSNFPWSKPAGLVFSHLCSEHWPEAKEKEHGAEQLSPWLPKALQSTPKCCSGAPTLSLSWQPWGSVVGRGGQRTMKHIAHPPFVCEYCLLHIKLSWSHQSFGLVPAYPFYSQFIPAGAWCDWEKVSREDRGQAWATPSRKIFVLNQKNCASKITVP